jgi:hypothetical protein
MRGLETEGAGRNRRPVRRFDKTGIDYSEDAIELPRCVSTKPPWRITPQAALVGLPRGSMLRGSGTLGPSVLCTRSQQEEVTG